MLATQRYTVGVAERMVPAWDQAPGNDLQPPKWGCSLKQLEGPVARDLGGDLHICTALSSRAKHHQATTQVLLCTGCRLEDISSSTRAMAIKHQLARQNLEASNNFATNKPPRNQPTSKIQPAVQSSRWQVTPNPVAASPEL